VTLVTLPLDGYSGWALEHRFGLSTQSLGAWALDQGKAFGFEIVAIGVLPLLALAWRVIESHPTRWWLWLSLGVLPVATATVLLQPLVFDPLFNKFTPLHDATLRTEILALAARADIPARHVYEVDMSTKTRKVNAYVSGFGASQRIVIWDTTLQKMAHDEILFVMGHEMGHYVLHHIWKGLGWVTLGSFAVLWLTAWLTGALLARYGGRWGVQGAGDLAAMPLLFAMLALVNFVGAPVSNAISRGVEHEADVFSLELTHDNDAGARSFLKLAEDNRSNPEPATWVKLLLFDHPPLGERIRFALEYKPWERGEPNRAYRRK
jgi:Zn-dependent protease with chaperone function